MRHGRARAVEPAAEIVSARQRCSDAVAGYELSNTVDVPMSGPARATDVLVVGAGPGGFLRALWPSRLDVCVRIIEKTAKPRVTVCVIVVYTCTSSNAIGLVSPTRWSAAITQ
jgi:hypothetical protein